MMFATFFENMVPDCVKLTRDGEVTANAGTHVGGNIKWNASGDFWSRGKLNWPGDVRQGIGCKFQILGCSDPHPPGDIEPASAVSHIVGCVPKASVA